MEVSGGGKFSHTIGTEQLSVGLRRSKRNPRNSGFMTTCQGAVGRDKVLQIIDALTRLDTAVAEGFPYPQLFVFINVTIICGQTKIYEWDGSSLVEKISVTAGKPWKAVDFFDYVYLSNREVAVVRSASDGTYSLTSDLPTALAICNFSGQVLVGAPDVQVSSNGLSLTADPISIILSQQGGWS